jgi:GxxExxY protein
MPIQISQPVKLYSEQEFHDLDFQVMRLAFDAHNQLGRLYDEKIYQNELIKLCQEKGLKTSSEVEIQLMHGSFVKNLFIDLLIEEGGIYELKAATMITPSHKTQTLGYLFLTDTLHGKIINFRPPSVEHEFVSTTLRFADRQNFSVCNKHWISKSEAAQKLKAIATALFSDWGVFLDTALYREAICHLYSKGNNIEQSIEVKNGSTVLGKQNLPLLSPEESFCISSVRNGLSTYQAHLQRFLGHTPLKHLHWININNLDVQFQTLSN